MPCQSQIQSQSQSQIQSQSQSQSQCQSQSDRERTHEGYVCVERSRAEGIKQRFRVLAASGCRVPTPTGEPVPVQGICAAGCGKSCMCCSCTHTRLRLWPATAPSSHLAHVWSTQCGASAPYWSHHARAATFDAIIWDPCIVTCVGTTYGTSNAAP
eukprot:360538-Chlamydomonas_euryale.AAC.4